MKTLFGTNIENPTPEQLQLMQKQLDLAKELIDQRAQSRKIIMVIAYASIAVLFGFYTYTVFSL